MPLSNQIKKETNHVFFSLLELDPEGKEESTFMSVLSDIASKHGTDVIDLSPYEETRSAGSSLPFYLVVEIKSLQFCLKHLLNR